jgi:hypothetical protein
MQVDHRSRLLVANSIQKGKCGPRDAFEQGPVRFGPSENPNAEQDAEQQTREIFGGAVPRDGTFGLSRFDRSVEKSLDFGKAVGDEGT